MITVRNTYPYVADGRFDEAYFLATHVPLAQSVLGDEVAGVRVLRPVALGGGAPPSRIVVEFDFPSREAMGRAFGSARMGELQADVANYSDVNGVVSVLDDGKTVAA